jgi:hypothetical protein
MEPVSFDAQSGYFQRAGKQFIPVGVNYWPGSSGVEMWKHWAPDEMREDLVLIGKLGLNTVRFFLRWEDFEPEAGKLDAQMLDRLVEWMDDIQRSGLYAHPSLFVGWMSGGVFWPEWIKGRNIFSGADLVERSEQFAIAICRILRNYKDSILSIDLGNELCCLPESSEAPPAAVEEWCRRVCAAIRSVYPEAIIISGNEQNQLVKDTGWHLGGQAGTDLYSMHGYPVPNWHPLKFDGLTDPLTAALLPAYVSAARAYGAVMLQEFGSILTSGIGQQDLYLRRLLPVCWESGANGFLYWCLRDIRSKAHPYQTNGFEGTLGLVDDRGRVKPGMEYFLEFSAAVQNQTPPDLDSISCGIYLSSQYYSRDNPACPGHSTEQQARGLALARYFYGRMGVKTKCVRGGSPLPAGLDTIIVAGPHLRVDEAEMLEQWVINGGRLIWHGPDPINWGPDYMRLLGAKPVNYRAAVPTCFKLGTKEYELTCYPRTQRVEVALDGAVAVAVDQDGLAVVITNQLGKGKVIAVLPQVEESVAAYSWDRSRRDAWIEFYRTIWDS